MLTHLIEMSLRNRFAVLVLAGVFAALGAWSVLHLPIDAFPDTTPVQVQINTTAPGLGPEEVEQQVTRPVEQALGGLPHLEQVRSLSRFGLSQVTVVFGDGTDIYFARQQVAERMASVELSEGLPRPRLGPIATGLGEVFHYLLAAKRTSLMDLRHLQDWVVRPVLRTVPGTAEINSWGGLEKQYQVRIDPKQLFKYGLTFDQVVQAIKTNNLNVGGGHMERAGGQYIVHGLGRVPGVAAIAATPVTAPRDGVAVKVGDVAEVAIGPDLALGGVTTQGQGEVVLGLGFLLMGENSHEVTRDLESRLDEIIQSKRLPNDVEVRPVYARTHLVDQVIDTVRRNLFEGGLLVIAVLFIFLGSLRAGLIVALAIPLSMLFAFTGMARFGIAGSLLSLGAIDFGLVVDSSVVMVENVVRHLAHEQNSGRSREEIVRDAAVEVRGPTLFGELIILIVYLPILTLEGVAGKLFRPMALTVIFALIGSMILSMTLMPVLASLLLPRKISETDPWVVRLARAIYRPILKLALRFRAAAAFMALGALGFGAVLANSLGGEFVPRLSEGALAINILRLPGTDLSESMRMNTRMEKLLLERFPDEIETIWSRSGSAEVATDPMGPEETDMFVTLKPRKSWTRFQTQEELEEAIREELKDIPGQRATVQQPIEQRVQEMTSGVRADVAVKIFGDDLEKLSELGEGVEKILKGIPGASEPEAAKLTGLPMLRVRLRRDQLARYGMSARAVLDQVEALGGKVVGDVVEGQFRFPLAVRLPRGLRSKPSEFGDLPVRTPSGDQLPLSRLAEVGLEEGPAKVLHEAGQRVITVKCGVKGRDVGSFVAEARRLVQKHVELPKDSRYHISWGGEFENLERARARLMLVAPAAMLLVLALLFFTYGRLMDVLLVFAAVPFAAVGGVVALWLRNMPFSVSAAVGFVALSGVSVLNNMLLVTFIRQLREQGLSRQQAVEHAALSRLRPVLMTALVASLGFVPMAFGTGVGAEVQRPLATVVIGGVVSSALMTLLVLPGFYHAIGPRRHGPTVARGAGPAILQSGAS
jgi:cobalt-zinc-cadmium resistance protein CzcA